MLAIENLVVRYPDTARPAVNSLSLEVGDGEMVCVVGESGSGKSTLALACLRLLGDGANVEGSIQLDGREILTMNRHEMRSVRGRQIGFVNQDALSSFSPLWTVGEQIAETIRVHTAASRSEAWRQTVEQLARVRLPNPERIAFSYPHELSGGQRQRAALAMALVLNPRLLIADEPTSALDVTTAAHLLALLKQLQREFAIGALLITHDLRVVESIADRVAVMYGGILGEIGAHDEVLRRPRFPYTKALMDSLDLGRERGKLGGIRGLPPGLSQALPGCPFAPRCDRAKAVCSGVLPQQSAVAGTTFRCHFPLLYEEARGRVHADH